MSLYDAKLDGVEYSLLSTWENEMASGFLGDAPARIVAYKSAHNAGAGGTEYLQDWADIEAWANDPTETNTVTLEVNPADQHGGVQGEGFRFQGPGASFGALLVLEEPFIILDGWDLWCTNDVNTNGSLLISAADVTVRNVFSRCDGTQSGDRALSLTSNAARPTIENICAWGGNGASGTSGVFFQGSGASWATNVVAIGYNWAFYSTNSNIVWTNCAGYGSASSDWAGTVNTASSKNNASEDTTAPGAGQVHNITLAAFEVGSGADWRPASGGALDGAGLSPPPLATDIAGNPYSDPPAIGAWEVTGGAPTPAVLSLPTTTDLASTSATIGCTTDTAGGTLHWYVSTSATPPSAQDLKGGTGAVSFGSLTPSLGANTASATGLSAGTNYYHHWIQDNGADSNILTSAQFTTLTPVEVQLGQAVEVDTGLPWGVSNPLGVQLGQAVEVDSALPWGIDAPIAIQLTQAVETDTALPWTPTSAVAVQMGQALEVDSALPWTPGVAQAVQLTQAVEVDNAMSWAVQGLPINVQMTQVIEVDTALPWTATVRTAVQMGQAVEVDTARPWIAQAPIKIQLGQATESDTALPWRASYAQDIQMGQAVEVDTAGFWVTHIAAPAEDFPYFRPSQYHGLYARFLGPLAQDIDLLVNTAGDFIRWPGVKAHVSQWREQDLVPDGSIKLGDLRLIIRADTLPDGMRPLEQKDRVEINGRVYGVINWDMNTRSIGADMVAIEATVRG